MERLGNSRKTPRAGWIDYDNGCFFITICTKDKKHFFGEVRDGKMVLSPIGEIVDRELSCPEIHHPGVEIPLFVVMPNHLHAIISISSDAEDKSSDLPALQRTPNPSLRDNPDVKRKIPALSQYIAGMKAAVTRQARALCPEFAWHGRYHDHYIRGARDGFIITDYILNNPANWDKDCFYPPVQP